jgi:DNA-binding NarL/FixJ family response regulator
MGTVTIRLLVADDHPIVREGLHRIVAASPDVASLPFTPAGGKIE